MKKVLLLVVVTTVLIGACRRNNTSNQLTTNYIPLNVDNYWIYNNYKIDEQGVETRLNTLDSVVVEGDTLIRNNTYYIYTTYITPRPYKFRTEIIRDSADCIVNDKGDVLFSSTNFSTVIREEPVRVVSDTIGQISYNMERIQSPVTVPAGTYNNVLNVKGVVVITSPNYSSIPSPRTLKKYYVQDIGRILESWCFLSGSDMYERRLLRYHIN